MAALGALVLIPASGLTLFTKVVPLKENSADFLRRYQEAGVGSLVKLIVLEGQGHNYFEGFFHSQELVDFAIARARAGAGL